jgi:hypothetical protein
MVLWATTGHLAWRPARKAAQRAAAVRPGRSTRIATALGKEAGSCGVAAHLDGVAVVSATSILALLPTLSPAVLFPER